MSNLPFSRTLHYRAGNVAVQARGHQEARRGAWSEALQQNPGLQHQGCVNSEQVFQVRKRRSSLLAGRKGNIWGGFLPRGGKNYGKSPWERTEGWEQGGDAFVLIKEEKNVGGKKLMSYCQEI